MTATRTNRLTTVLPALRWLLLPFALAHGAAPAQLATDFVSITAGNHHTCATRVDGRTYCWGLNDMGQAGYPYPRSCGSAPCVEEPSYVLTAPKVEAGPDHTCAIDRGGRALCWGSNLSGQAGVPSPTRVMRPTYVQGYRAMDAISAGPSATCATSAGVAYCWGKLNPAGTASPSTASVPAPVYAPLPFDGLAVGNLHACAIGFATRSFHCWGANAFGQAALDPLSHPQATLLDAPLVEPQVARVASQFDTTCVELLNGMLQCFGRNDWGQLGNGTYAGTFVPQYVGNGMPLRGVTIGDNHACAIDPEGRGWCWGNGQMGELGNGGPTVSPRPVMVAGGSLRFRALAAGAQHTCGIDVGNRLFCWGSNRYAQIGIRDYGFTVYRPMMTERPRDY